MIKESKYIIRRILIGVGIVLVLGFLNGCKVKAYDYSPDNAFLSGSVYDSGREYYYYWYFNDENNSLDLKSGNGNINSYSLSSQPYFYLGGASGNNLIQCDYEFTSKLTSVDNGHCISRLFNKYSGSVISTITSFSNTSLGGSPEYCNFDIPYYNSSTIYCHKNIDTTINLEPEFVSLHYNKIVNNNVITGALFSPEFSVWDIDNYKYEYEWNNNGVWISLTQNNQVLNFNANGDLRFRIVDKSDNSVIDSASFTITNIMQLNDNNVNYDIKYDYRFMTSCDTSNTNCNILQGITGGELTINYIPVSNSFYNYYWQFVNEGSSLDNNSWNQISSSDNGSRVYETNVNGTMYAKIEDKEGNVLYSSTFTINNIGKDTIVSGSTGNSFFDKINRNINYGGPIASIIRVPITILTTIGGAFSSGSMTCSPYNLGSLWGTNLYLPCVNVKQHLGNSLYMTIDLICSGVMIYYIFKFICLMYDKFMNLDRDPAGNLDDVLGGRD